MRESNCHMKKNILSFLLFLKKFFVSQSRRTGVWVYLGISSYYWMKCAVYLDESMCMPCLKRQTIITKKTPSSKLIDFACGQI